MGTETATGIADDDIETILFSIVNQMTGVPIEMISSTTWVDSHLMSTPNMLQAFQEAITKQFNLKPEQTAQLRTTLKKGCSLGALINLIADFRNA